MEQLVAGLLCRVFILKIIWDWIPCSCKVRAWVALSLRLCSTNVYVPDLPLNCERLSSIVKKINAKNFLKRKAFGLKNRENVYFSLPFFVCWCFLWRNFSIRKEGNLLMNYVVSIIHHFFLCYFLYFSSLFPIKSKQTRTMEWMDVWLDH